MRRTLRSAALPALRILLLLLLYGSASAQTDSNTPETAPDFQPKASIGLSTGSHAFVGGDLTLSLIRPVNFRLSFNRMNARVNDYLIDASSFGFESKRMLLSADARLSTIGITAELPVTRSGWLRLLGGAMVNLDNSITVSGRFRDGIQLNDYTVTPDRIGEIQAHYTTDASLYPFLGLGLGRSIAKNRLSFALELGAFMRGRPDIEITSTGLLEGNEQNGPALSENFRNVRMHPSVSLRLGYTLNVPPHWLGRKGRTDAEEATAEQEREEVQQSTAATETAEEEQKEETAVSPYVILQGKAINGANQLSLNAVYIDVYRVDDNGERELIRAQRYPNGQFQLYLEPLQDYELELFQGGFKSQTAALRFRDEDRGQTLQRTFQLFPE